MRLLKIRREQMDALDQHALDDFRERMVRTMSEIYPDSLGELGADTMRATVRSGVDRAARYGVEQEDDVERFLALLFELGVDFETRADCAWAQKILSNPKLSGPSKLDMIEEMV